MGAAATRPPNPIFTADPPPHISECPRAVFRLLDEEHEHVRAPGTHHAHSSLTQARHVGRPVVVHERLGQVSDAVTGSKDREERMVLLASRHRRAHPERFAKPPAVLEKLALERHVPTHAKTGEIRQLKPPWTAWHHPQRRRSEIL